MGSSLSRPGRAEAKDNPIHLSSRRVRDQLSEESKLFYVKGPG
jgi:hypothetical protein